MKNYSNWDEVFEALTEEEKAEIRRVNYSDLNYFPDGVGDEKIIADVEQYFDDNIGESEENCKNYGVPDAVDGVPAFTKENFLWALNL